MKKILVLYFFIFAGPFAFTQYYSPPVQSNGLIYPDTCIYKLRNVIDSLNLKFKHLKYPNKFMSLPMARGHYISFYSNSVLSAVKDMESHISPEDLLEKYPQSEMEKDVLIVRKIIQDYDGKEFLYYTSIDFKENSEFTIRFETNNKEYKYPKKGSWVYTFREPSLNFPGSLTAFYFEEDLKKKPIPIEYSRMISYSRFLLDTIKVYLKIITETNRFNPLPEKVDQFLAYAHKLTEKPEYVSGSRMEFSKLYHKWSNVRLNKLDSLKPLNPIFDSLLYVSINDALNKGSNNEYEEYIEHYISPDLSLALKRNRTIYTRCGNDDGPQIHLFNIARLAALTTNWRVFLISHLSLMRSKSYRIGDIGWTFTDDTYIKELEEINLNSIDLLIGNSLETNVNKLTYHNNLKDLGGMLVDSKYLKNAEDIMYKMLKNDNLDDYNRSLVFLMIESFNHNISDEVKKRQNGLRLLEAVQTMPNYIKDRIVGYLDKL